MNILALLLLSASAYAEEILVESEPYIVRGDAVQLHAEIMEGLPDSSNLSVRLVRRFHQGQGWRYLVVIEGAEDAEQAEALAALGEGMAVLLPEEPVGVATPEDVPAAEPADADEAAEEPVAEAAPAEEGPRLMEATGVLRAAVRAHGGREGAGVLIDQAQSVRFSYKRAVPETDGQLVAMNHFLRKGDAVRLEVTIEAGTGVDSVTTLTSDRQGWVSVDEEHTARDPGRTLEILERFSPEAVLAIPLGFPEDVETAAAWRDLQTVDRIEDGEGEVWVLKGEGMDAGLKEASFDVQERRLRRVTWSSARGDITFIYDDYQSLEKDLIIPFRTRIERDGELIEEITVSNFEVNPVLADELFAAPQ